MFKIYINGMGNVSPQHSTQADFWEQEPVLHNGDFCRAQEPEYKNYIQSGLIRRMSRVVRMSLAASNIAMQAAGAERVDAILTGTAYGCIQDTEKFLTAIVENGEQMLTPTAFVQSTHNTIGGQIALLRENTCYNLTYVHRGFSFESGLLDAALRILEGESKCALVGGVDELTENAERFMAALGCTRCDAGVGEGAAFFVLSPERNEHSQAMLCGIKMLYKPTDSAEVKEALTHFLEDIGWGIEEVDAIVLGNAGNADSDSYYSDIQQQLFAHKTQFFFKNLCGEYATSTAFALWLAAGLVARGSHPIWLKTNGVGYKKIHKVLIYNNHRGINHNFLALSVC